MGKEKSIFAIVGESGSGKDTIIEKGFGRDKMIVSYTTRKMREGETNGVEHYFVDDKQFDKIENTTQLIAWTKTGNVRYCATTEELNTKMFYIINPDGIKWFKEHPIQGVKMVSIGIYLPLEERKKRISSRSDFSTAFNKRVMAEQQEYIDYRKNGDFDYMITNWDLDKSIKVLKAIVDAETNN